MELHAKVWVRCPMTYGLDGWIVQSEESEIDKKTRHRGQDISIRLSIITNIKLPMIFLVSPSRVRPSPHKGKCFVMLLDEAGQSYIVTR